MPSTVIAAYHYIAERKVLRITYQSGSVYEYFDVPEEIYREMKESFSKGVFLNARVKNNYAFNKVK